MVVNNQFGKCYNKRLYCDILMINQLEIISAITSIYVCNYLQKENDLLQDNELEVTSK